MNEKIIEILEKNYKRLEFEIINKFEFSNDVCIIINMSFYNSKLSESFVIVFNKNIEYYQFVDDLLKRVDDIILHVFREG